MKRNYTIYMNNKGIESHDTPGQTLRAMLCIMAQERKYGRTINSVLFIPAEVVYLDQMPSSVPNWIVEVLGQEFIDTYKRPT
jgi:hypothetical protein